MKKHLNPSLPFFLLTTLLITGSIKGMGQPGMNGGKPIITYHTTEPVSIKTQSPPAFPGGENKLNAFVLRQLNDTENPVKVGRKTWLTASLDGTGKVTELIPSHDADPTLKKEMARVGASMPRWTPGMINGQGVETKFQFLLRR